MHLKLSTLKLSTLHLLSSSIELELSGSQRFTFPIPPSIPLPHSQPSRAVAEHQLTRTLIALQVSHSLSVQRNGSVATSSERQRPMAASRLFPEPTRQKHSTCDACTCVSSASELCVDQTATASKLDLNRDCRRSGCPVGAFESDSAAIHDQVCGWNRLSLSLRGGRQ